MNLSPGQIWWGVAPDGDAEMVIEVLDSSKDPEVPHKSVKYHVWTAGGRSTAGYHYDRNIMETWVNTTATLITPSQKDCLVNLWGCELHD